MFEGMDGDYRTFVHNVRALRPYLLGREAHWHYDVGKNGWRRRGWRTERSKVAKMMRNAFGGCLLKMDPQRYDDPNAERRRQRSHS